jgi:hypothetical protein
VVSLSQAIEVGSLLLISGMDTRVLNDDRQSIRLHAASTATPGTAVRQNLRMDLTKCIKPILVGEDVKCAICNLILFHFQEGAATRCQCLSRY